MPTDLRDLIANPFDTAPGKPGIDLTDDDDSGTAGTDMTGGDEDYARNFPSPPSSPYDDDENGTTDSDNHDDD